jgi:hypothetical protein
MQLHTLLGMQAEDIALHSYAFEVLLEEISLLFLLQVCLLYIVHHWFVTEVQFYIKLLFN